MKVKGIYALMCVSQIYPHRSRSVFINRFTDSKSSVSIYSSTASSLLVEKALVIVFLKF